MRKLFSLLFLAVALSLNATVYHISPTGNDVTGNGTIATPWKTLYKACAAVTTPGDFIHVYAGTYIETVQCVLAPGVSIEGDGVTSIIKSTVTGTFVEVLNMRSASEGVNGNQSISYLSFDGQMINSWGICITGRSNVSVHHCNFVDFIETAVNFSGFTDPTAAGLTEPGTYSTGNSFYNNTVYNCSSNTLLFGTKYGKGCMQFGGQDGFACYNNDIQQPGRVSGNYDDIGWPIKMANRGHIKNCSVHDNILKRAVIANVQGINENWFFSFEMWYVHGGFLFYNNTCTGELDLANVSKGAAAFGAKIYNNTFSLPALNTFKSYAIRLETDEADIEMYGNIGYNIMGPLVLNPKDYENNGNGINVHRINFHHNLFYNLGITGGGGTSILPDNRAINPQTYFDDFYIDNNTLIAASGGNAAQYGIEIPSYNGGNTRRIYVRNNLIQGFGLNSSLIGNGAMLDSLFYLNNCEYLNGTNGIYIFSGGTPTHYNVTGNISSNPNLNGSYTPNPGSPLLNAGYDGATIGHTGGTGNISPTASAGADQSLSAGTTTATLSGSGTDPDGTITGYSWTKLSGPSCSITSPSSASTGLTGLTAGTYVFQLQVTDNLGATGTATVTLTIAAAGAVEIRFYRPIKMF